MSLSEEKVILALKKNGIDVIRLKKIESSDEKDKIIEQTIKKQKKNSIIAFSEFPPNKILQNRIQVDRNKFTEILKQLHIDLSKTAFEAEDLLSNGVNLTALRADFVLVKKDMFGNLSYYIIEPGDLHHNEVQNENYTGFARQIINDLAKEEAAKKYNINFYAFTTSKYDNDYTTIKSKIENFLKEVLL